MKIKKRDNALDSRIAHIVYSYSHKLSDIEIERMIDELTEIIRKEKDNEFYTIKNNQECSERNKNIG